MRSFLRRHWPRLLFLLCLALVLIAVFQPYPPPELFLLSDKVGHVLGFLALCLSGRIAFPRFHPAVFWSFFLLLSWVLEWLQGIIQPSRIASAGDAVANMAGACLALGILVLWRKRKTTWR